MQPPLTPVPPSSESDRMPADEGTRPLVVGAHAVLRALLAVALIAAVVVLLSRQSGSLGVEVERRDPSPGVDEIRVDVGGAVREPSVVTAQPGERVTDAIERAGGVTEDADLAALNLARRVVDEDRVRVPRLGEQPALLNLNEATQEELEALPGIGPVRADAIIAAREEESFASTDDLVERQVIPAGVYEDIRDLIATPEVP
ncbi:MAG: SLBB domain-containing protein [Dehalococcoidia bacterium]